MVAGVRTIALALALGSCAPETVVPSVAALSETVASAPAHTPLVHAPLTATDGTPFAAERWRGRWSVIFLGFASCADVCPLTVHALAAVARDPASGVSAGTTQLVFVTVDPRRDTRARLRSYLAAFGGGIVGLTGTPAAIDHFRDALGGGALALGTGFDHSTSLFVLDPDGRPAGLLLRPTEPARIVADLNRLRRRGSDDRDVAGR